MPDRKAVQTLKSFYVINSGNKELFHHIQFYLHIIKTRQLNFPNFISSYIMIFNFNYIHLISQTFII